MAYKSVRQKCLESTISEMAADFNREEFSKMAAKPNQSYMIKKDPTMPYCTCYLCGTKNNLKEIFYGQTSPHTSNSMIICLKCCNHLGKFLVSDKAYDVRPLDNDV